MANPTRYNSAPRGVPVSLQSAATTGNGNAVAIPNSFTNHTWKFQSVGTTSGGVITIEEAADPSYTGTWSTLTTVNASDFSGGAEKDVHASGLLRAVRARISSNITGGGTIS